MKFTADKVKAGLMLAGAAFVTWKLYQASQAVGKVVDAVQEEVTTTFNPASDENFIYKGTQGAGNFIGESLFKLFN